MPMNWSELELRLQSLETAIEHLPTETEVSKTKDRLRVSVICTAISVIAALGAATTAAWSVLALLVR